MPAPTNERWQRVCLGLLVFTAGLVTLGAELSASRLLAPFFGTSLVVWTSLIGLILLALALGYRIGGKLADRNPSLFPALRLMMAAALLVGLAPDLSRPAFSLALRALGGARMGLLAGSFLGVVAILGLPMVLLGTISPFAIRLATRQVEESGRVAGHLYALSTLGSFVGAFLPVLVLIPSVGTRWTFLILALLLLVVVSFGFLICRRYGWAALSAAVAAALAAIGHWRSGLPIKGGPGVLFEGESPYQYVRVVEDSAAWRRLLLNEGLVTHSKYHPREPLTFGEWDYFAVAPLFCAAPVSEPQFRRWALIGAGAGTTARLVHRLYADARVDGVELDPLVAEVGARYFGDRPPEYRVVVQDGRTWLRLNRETYDVIGLDAYRQPYIPFELTTVECFRQVRDHLSPNGVAAINVAHPAGDDRLVAALLATLREAFPSVYALFLGESHNTTILIATRQPTTTDDFRRNLAGTAGLLRLLGEKSDTLLTPGIRPGPVLTDDRAPVERLMDAMVFVYALQRRTTWPR